MLPSRTTILLFHILHFHPITPSSPVSVLVRFLFTSLDPTPFAFFFIYLLFLPFLSLPNLPHRRKLIEEPRSRKVVEFRIFLDDDQLKATVKVCERRKALLEGIRHNRVSISRGLVVKVMFPKCRQLFRNIG